MPSPQAPPPGATALDPTAVRPPLDDAVVERIEPRALRDRLLKLKAEGFAMLLDIGCVDYLERMPRFDVVYHLLKLPVLGAAGGIGTPPRIRLLVGVSGEPPRVPTITDLWPCADWAEREVYDLFGVVFDGHPDLRRIQMPLDWEGHPLRRDYPLRGPARERTPRPGFALKSNIPAGTPPSGRTAAALNEEHTK